MLACRRSKYQMRRRMVPIEDDLFNTLKHINFGGNVDPLKMVGPLLRNLERVMLERMLAQVTARLNALKGEDRDMDPFRILGVKADCTKEEVVRAYKQKAAKVHPDVGGSNIEMAKVNAAKDAIFLYKGWKN